MGGQHAQQPKVRSSEHSPSVARGVSVGRDTSSNSTVAGNSYGSWSAAAGPAFPLAIQRKISVNGEVHNRHKLALEFRGANLLTPDTPPYKVLWPIALEWVKTGQHEANSLPALRTDLVREWYKRQMDGIGPSIPNLKRHLAANQLCTVVCMNALLPNFNVSRLEGALKGVVGAKHVDQSTLAQTITTGKVPETQVTFGLFTDPHQDRIPNIDGLIAELQVAASVDPQQLQGGQKVRMSSDFSLEGQIGGQAKQDADVSFVDKEGQKVLVEVGSHLQTIRTKMGNDGQAQRQRYERVQELNDSVVLAYATPEGEWSDFFAGEEGASIAERLPGLGAGWGLLIEGRYWSPDELTRIAAVIREAEPYVRTFWHALARSGLTLVEVAKLGGRELAERLQRNVRRLQDRD